MLYSPDGSVLGPSQRPSTRAERQLDREESLRQKVKDLDALLDIRYIEWAGRYSLVCQWPQIDKRWELYHNGDISEPFDSLGWFCMDMQDPSSLPVSLEDVENKVIELLGKCDNTRYPWKGRMAEHITRNRKVREDRKQLAIDQAADVAKTLYRATGHKEEVQIERMLKEVSEGKV